MVEISSGCPRLCYETRPGNDTSAAGEIVNACKAVPPASRQE
jgi:hypothetical protein